VVRKSAPPGGSIFRKAFEPLELRHSASRSWSRIYGREGTNPGRHGEQPAADSRKSFDLPHPQQHHEQEGNSGQFPISGPGYAVQSWASFEYAFGVDTTAAYNQIGLGCCTELVLHADPRLVPR
jgi:hypothetical protein